MADARQVPAYFHRDQLSFRPQYEWAFGNKIEHPERTERADNILSELEAADRFDVRSPRTQPIQQVAQQHAPHLLRLYETARGLPEHETYNPSVFYHRESIQPDPKNINHAGYFCFDSGTPLSRETRTAALWSAACALAAAHAVQAGQPLAYALSRPPGHHASYEDFGGYCYINNSALAAKHLSHQGRVAVLDIDVHHGNGTQALFWRSADVLTVSIHADPANSFPFFTGSATENGAGPGRHRNVNLPLDRGTDGQAYLRALERHALPLIAAFEPCALVVAAGVDAYHKDPVGDFALTTQDFFRVGERIGALRLPTCAVQEGGYYTPHIGRNVVAVIDGIATGLSSRQAKQRG